MLPRALAALVSRLGDPSDRAASAAVAVALLAFEAALCALIVLRVPYTEIDWRAYMDEVGGYLAGERDYANLRGSTGPLVYPAGFVYVFALLSRVTSGGDDIALAQGIFAVLYLANLAVVFAVYVRAELVPPWALALLCLSKRAHSIFLLRLFNDGVAMFLAHAALFAFQSRRWRVGAVVFSLAVSVKMNVLLMLPPLLVLIVGGERLTGALHSVALIIVAQLVIGAEFLASHPRSYVSKAFEFTRAFFYRWTVNWKFVSEPLFLSATFARGLLVAHLVTLFAFAHRKWYRYEVPGDEGDGVREPGRLGSRPGSSSSRRRRRGFFFDFFVDFFARARGNAPAPAAYATKLTPRHVALCVFEGNFVGVVFARSLHYQFYAWYFFSLPALLFAIPNPSRSERALAPAPPTRARRRPRGDRVRVERLPGDAEVERRLTRGARGRAARTVASGGRGGGGEGGGAAGGEKTRARREEQERVTPPPPPPRDIASRARDGTRIYSIISYDVTFPLYDI